MNIDEKIAQRLKHTEGLQEINAQSLAKIEGIRKSAMRGDPVPEADQKWLVRTLLEALTFKSSVLDIWIEDDSKTLRTGGASTEPRLDLTEPAPETTPEPADIVQEEVPEDSLETVPSAEAEPDGIAKINAVLDSLKF